jgi:hypothetical protein
MELLVRIDPATILKYPSLRCEANIRRAFNDLPIGTEIQKLLGPQSEAILQSTTDHLIERVHESLENEEELARYPQKVTAEFFGRVCDGLTYESYLGHFGEVDDINSKLLYAILESLEERFEEGLRPLTFRASSRI